MANELVVRMSPTSVPCSDAASATDPVKFPPQTISLQISVVNTSNEVIDLSDAALVFDFPVDPGGSGSAAALVLAQPGVTPPKPYQPIQAAAADGTNWTIGASPSSSSGFTAFPGTATGGTNPGVLAPSGQGSVTFVFSKIAVDAVPGQAAIGVRLQGATNPSDVTVDSSAAAVMKTEADFGITSFAASPLIVRPMGTAGLTWTTTGAASCLLSWSPPDAATVNDDQGRPFVSGSAVSAQTDPTRPYVATLNAPTSFTLTASGAGASQIASVFVDVARPAVYLTTGPSPCVVAPYVPFTLSWMAFNTQNVELTWDPPDNATVIASDGTELVNGGSVLAQSSARVSLTGLTTFNLIADTGVSAQAVASLKPLQLTGLEYGQFEDAAGTQYVMLDWICNNATVVDVYAQTLSGSTWTPVAHVGYPSVLEPHQTARADLYDRTTFHVTALGDPAKSPMQDATQWVTPFPVEIDTFYLTYGEAYWDVRHATSVQLSAHSDLYTHDRWGELVWLGHYDNVLWTGLQGEHSLYLDLSNAGPQYVDELGFTLTGFGLPTASATYWYGAWSGIGIHNLVIDTDSDSDD